MTMGPTSHQIAPLAAPAGDSAQDRHGRAHGARPHAPKERELRLDLFRGLALWLIFIDHLSPDILTWFTIRNYGLSDAAEIFIFVSGYTAAMVYGRVMQHSGFRIAAARILRRVSQIYIAHMVLFFIFLGEVFYATADLRTQAFIDEMGLVEILNHPAQALVQALLLRFRPLNMDVLPLYIVVMTFLPLVLWSLLRHPDLTLVGSVFLYILTWRYDLYLSAWPSGFWAFNPFAWQLLFFFGSWCAMGGAKRLATVIAHPATIWIAFLYILAAFFLTLTWTFPELSRFVPHIVEELIYPIDKTDLDVLRFTHFLCVAAIAVRLVPPGWPLLQADWLRPMILCGQHSLGIFCFGTFLAFVGEYLLVKADAGLPLHALAGVTGIAIMCSVAWLASWLKNADNRGAGRINALVGEGDFVGHA